MLITSKKLLLLLVSFIIYGCSSPQRATIQPITISPDLPIVTATFIAPSSNAQKKEIVLVKNTDNQRYYLSNLNGSDMIPLDIPANNRGIALSPNGQLIAYLPNTSQGLYLLDVKNMSSTTLLETNNYRAGIGLAWSTDNQNIAFSCGIQGTIGLSLCLVNIQNPKNVQVLVKAESFGAADILDGVFSPSWSSDGSKIAFLSIKSLPSSGGKSIPRRDIWLFDVSTQTAQKIFSDNTDGISYIFNPAFLPSENAVLFSGRKERFNTVFKYEIDANKIQDLTSTDNSFDLIDFILSPDEKTFLGQSPSPDNPSQYVPTLYSLNGQLLEQLNFLKNLQVISRSTP